MDYREAVQWIHSRETFGIKPGLKRMEWLMEKLNHPQKKIKAIHIAGTNGKGSTLSFLRHIMQSHGYSVGTFTSPYIVKFNERISVDGQPIPDDEMTSFVEKIKPLCLELEKTELGPPTEFEVITAIAFDYFSQQDLDYVLFETGLGGRLDSTNVVQPILTIITNVGLDHTAILGNTYEQIAYEKAGIMKEQIPLVTAVTEQQSLHLIKRKASELSVPLDHFSSDFRAKQLGVHDGLETFSFFSKLGDYSELAIQMRGFHQVVNASTALQAFLRLSKMVNLQVDTTKVKEGLFGTTWPGRFETVHHHPLVIIDGAHNKEGIETLIQTVERFYPEKRKHLLFSAMKDKALSDMINLFNQAFTTVTFTTFEFERAAKAENLFELSDHPNKHLKSNWEASIKELIQSIDPMNEVIIISGSLYFISVIRQYFEIN
ncbi:bifunctional folylpolyglutamate synthase/dihydrofolate synthase [Salinibacillus xinjiangensis]|uniref:Dihydrofolate synthase/folylpolyglutamate synthase n=1 Tax=Salinibacillus xinjiangensis TaxID=1229268 RepID=A0A6G1XBC8_9BACI|nr:folylpolyglutamate synthase/dihydrofolate synthase family protein [Salinibacillus xinjiangensis]MRG88215.1 bifunctional folylpolyglutamate synthase/dihydrofolate synthase [Salinibacillus xinjiangensis]